MRRLAAVVGVVVLGVAGSASAAPVTWHINTPWDFHTSTIPPTTNLVGTITFDRAVSNYYPIAWDFHLEHGDPAFAAHFPLDITDTYPNLSDASGTAWTFRGQVLPTYTVLTLSFGPGGFQSPISNTLLDGTSPSVTFSASEYVHRGSIASQRLIYAGTATLVPAPAGAGVLAMVGMLGLLRRR